MRHGVAMFMIGLMLSACGKPVPNQQEGRRSLAQVGDGSWFDAESHLIWRTADSGGAVTYDEALARSAAMNANSKDTPWRLPRLAEIQDLRSIPGAAEQLAPSNTRPPSDAFWTTDRYLSYTAINWTVDLHRGIDRPARRVGANPDRRLALLVKGDGGLYARSDQPGMEGRWTRSRAVFGVPVREGKVRIAFRALHPVITPNHPVHVSLADADGGTTRSVRLVQPGSQTLEIPASASTTELTPVIVETSPAWYEGGEERGVFLEGANWR